jgi:hypothetical protein
MNHHGRRLTRRDAEQLLSDPSSSSHALGPVLDAARSSQVRSALPGEEVAVAAFVASRFAAAHQGVPVVPPVRKTVTKALAATGLVVALTSGGVALAATGHLPVLPDQASDRATESVAKHATPSETTTETTSDTTTGTTSGTTTEPVEPGTSETSEPVESGTAEPTGDATAAPTPSFRGLCKAFQANDKSGAGKALDSAAFTALAAEAGGKDAIATYCVALIGEPKETGKPEGTGKPEQPGKPSQTGKPEGAGKPEQPGKPEVAGKPEQPGKPEGAGKPERSGKPDDAGKPDGAGQGSGHR